jgi:hypothetical protein
MRGNCGLRFMYRSVERRIIPRRRIATEGVIWHEHPYSMVICTVRDVSPAGAGLSLPNGVSPLPAEFDLIFDGLARRCAAAWQHLGRMGVKFKST